MTPTLFSMIVNSSKTSDDNCKTQSTHIGTEKQTVKQVLKLSYLGQIATENACETEVIY